MYQAIKDDKELQRKANDIRKKVVSMVHAAKSGHPGGPLGLADIFAVLYHNILRHDPSNPDWDERDRLLLSNGHCCAVRYSAMAQTGYLPEEELLTFRDINSRLQGHPSSVYLPGVETCSGSLGQGLSVAAGLALGARTQKKDYKVFVGISDGECAEGMTWEAAQAAPHYKLDNLIAFLDRNYIQIDGNTEDVMAQGDLRAKFEAFGWEAVECDGHDIPAIRKAFEEAIERSNKKPGKPQMIVFRTVLGKGVSYMEHNPKWHGSPPNDEQKAQALAELDKLDN
jgi:transketolase